MCWAAKQKAFGGTECGESPLNAVVAELAYAHDSGSCPRRWVRVQVSSTAKYKADKLPQIKTAMSELIAVFFMLSERVVLRSA